MLGNWELYYMKTYGILPRIDREGDFPVSRDWKHVDCKAIGCEFNTNESCLIPSRAKLNEEGKCEGFSIKLVKKVDGD